MSSATGNQARSGNYTTKAIKPDIDLPGLMREHPERYPFLLQSNASGPNLARYDILFACPGSTLKLDANHHLEGPFTNHQSGFLHALDSWWATEKTTEPGTDELPFSGGWFLYLAYELAAEVEPGLRLQTDADQPIAFATRIPAAIIIDHQKNTACVVVETGREELLGEIETDLACTGKSDPVRLLVKSIEEEPAEHFIANVHSAQKFIAAGDIFQANLSRSWRATFHDEADPYALYASLCASNPAPFAGLVIQDNFALMSSSPERLVKRKGSRIDTRPIAGTRPRNEAPGGSDERRRELLQHPKERAEHIMLIDLERNDLGRVCVGGSVKVDEFMVVETYSHVHHIVSNITGQARPELTPGDLIRATFPGGTITGCPKVRCMEIISELEARPRGAYTGSMGYLNRNGDCDLNILIRTMTMANNEVVFSAGSGIVADSNPQAELEETRAKAKGLLLALEQPRSAT